MHVRYREEPSICGVLFISNRVIEVGFFNLDGRCRNHCLKSASIDAQFTKPNLGSCTNRDPMNSTAATPLPLQTDRSQDLVFLETFGCQMNVLDSELVIGQLNALGYGFTDNWRDANVILFNTCSVREHAEDKVYSRLGRVAQQKKAEEDRTIVLGVIGCMAERDGKDMIRRYPQVDILCGPGELDKLPMLIDNAMKTNCKSAIAIQGNTSRRSSTLAAAEDQLELLDLSRSFNPDIRAGVDRFSSYVRVTRGCNKFCTYCVVPFTRGAEMHRPPEHILDECKRLADAGVKEITLLGQTVNHYRYEHDHATLIDSIAQPQKGRSYQGGHERDPFEGDRVTTFANLLYRVHEEIPALERIRFVTSFPRDFGNDVLEVIRDCPRICRYIHVPAQSGSNRMLDMMNRGYTVEEYRDFVERIREFIPEAQIAGDMIVGFPTETDAEFDLTVDLLKWCKYKNCFVFKYSARPGTTAYDKIPDDIPDDVKKYRNNILLAAQAEISNSIHAGFIGQTLDVFVEGISSLEARTQTKSKPHEHNAVGLTVGGKDIRVVSQSPRTMEVINTNPAVPSTSPTAVATASGSGFVQMSGRTSGDLITVFDMPAAAADAMIGRIVPIEIHKNAALTLFGRYRG